jgi:hypothetical protein
LKNAYLKLFRLNLSLILALLLIHLLIHHLILVILHLIDLRIFIRIILEELLCLLEFKVQDTDPSLGVFHLLPELLVCVLQLNILFNLLKLTLTSENPVITLTIPTTLSCCV